MERRTADAVGSTNRGQVIAVAEVEFRGQVAGGPNEVSNRRGSGARLLRLHFMLALGVIPELSLAASRHAVGKSEK